MLQFGVLSNIYFLKAEPETIGLQSTRYPINKSSKGNRAEDFVPYGRRPGSVRCSGRNDLLVLTIRVHDIVCLLARVVWDS